MKLFKRKEKFFDKLEAMSDEDFARIEKVLKLHCAANIVFGLALFAGCVVAFFVFM